MRGDTIEEHLSDRAVEYADEYIGQDVQIGPVVVPPVGRSEVKSVVADYDGSVDDDMLLNWLYDLTDLSLAINHSGDTMLDNSLGDRPPYSMTDDSVAEVKIAHGALLSCYNREIRAMADTLGTDVEQTDDYVSAIQEQLEFERNDDTIDEEWTDL